MSVSNVCRRFYCRLKEKAGRGKRSGWTWLDHERRERKSKRRVTRPREAVRAKCPQKRSGWGKERGSPAPEMEVLEWEGRVRTAGRSHSHWVRLILGRRPNKYIVWELVLLLLLLSPIQSVHWLLTIVPLLYWVTESEDSSQVEEIIPKASSKQYNVLNFQLILLHIFAQSFKFPLLFRPF